MRSLFFCSISAFEKPRRAINKTVNLPDLFISTLARAALAGAAIAMLANCKTPVEPQAPQVVQSTMRAPDEVSKALPPDLYKTMPMYPGAVVEHVRKPKGAMREILFSAQGDLPTMVAYYKDALKKNDFHITSSLIMPARKTWSCDFHNRGRPGSIMLFPSDTDKSRMTIDLIYELPAHIDESMMEPREDFDVKGPGEIANQAQNLNPNPSEKEKRN
jgi:hypothetical protein